MEDVPARAGLVREDQIRGLRLEPPDQFVEIRLARANRADEHGRHRRVPLGVGDGDRILVDVETNEKRYRPCAMADLRSTGRLTLPWAALVPTGPTRELCWRSAVSLRRSHTV